MQLNFCKGATARYFISDVLIRVATYWMRQQRSDFRDFIPAWCALLLANR